MHIILTLFEELYKINGLAVFFLTFKDTFPEQELQANVKSLAKRYKACYKACIKGTLVQI